MEFANEAVVSIRTLRPVKAGEELIVSYRNRHGITQFGSIIYFEKQSDLTKNHAEQNYEKKR